MLIIQKHKILWLFYFLFLFGMGNIGAQISFSALPDCDDNAGTEAAVNSMYIHINAIANTDGVNDITFTGMNASGGALSITESGTGIGATDTNGSLLVTGLSPSDYGTVLTITLENNGTTQSIELPVAICGFSVDTGGDGNVEDDVSNGVFCSPQNGASAPGILAQVLPSTDVNSENDITSTYVYVLVDNTSGDAIEAVNTTGLFDNSDGVENLHNYTLYAFYVSDIELANFNTELGNLSTISTGDDILTNGGRFANFCYNFCCEATFSPYCCDAEAGDITSTSFGACEGSSTLLFNPTVGLDGNGNSSPTAPEYDYIFLAVEGGIIREVSATGFDFTTYSGPFPITYTIYGLSYRSLEINNFTNVSSGNILELMGTAFADVQNDISLAPSTSQVCGELTDADFTVTIFDEPTANPQAATMCFGGFLDVNGQAMEGMGTFNHSWSILNGANTTATGVTLSNDDMSIVTVNSDINGTTGTVELEYTVSDGNMCSTTTTVIITIDPCDIGSGDDVMLDDPCECLNNATNDENGQFAEVISIFSFAAGQDWYIQSVNSFNTSATLPNDGLFAITSPTPPAAATPFAVGSTGVQFVDASTDGIDNDMMNGVDDAGEDGLYYLEAIHYDGLGFVLTVANDALGITRTITNRGCFYPMALIDIPATLCSSSLPFDLSTTGSGLLGSDGITPTNADDDSDAVYATGTDFFNNVIASNFPAGGVFDLYDANGNLIGNNIAAIPNTIASAGNYTLVYTFNEDDTPPNPQPMGSSIDIGPFDRGCIDATSVSIRINLVDCNSFPWNGRNE